MPRQGYFKLALEGVVLEKSCKPYKQSVAAYKTGPLPRFNPFSEEGKTVLGRDMPSGATCVRLCGVMTLSTGIASLLLPTFLQNLYWLPV